MFNCGDYVTLWITDDDAKSFKISSYESVSFLSCLFASEDDSFFGKNSCPLLILEFNAGSAYDTGCLTFRLPLFLEPVPFDELDAEALKDDLDADDVTAAIDARSDSLILLLLGEPFLLNWFLR